MVVAALNQEKALVGAFSKITNLRMDLFEALVTTFQAPRPPPTSHSCLTMSSETEEAVTEARVERKARPRAAAMCDLMVLQ